ncbi:MAG: metallophosphatase family protein [Gemmatimonadaceae bacterium]|jgi:putative phosphoesterase|nr:metallophosphatase family protein [Gemmatimonadaceae bacterium]
MTPVPLEGRGGDTIAIGLISDTHGLLRPEVFTALAGVSEILHAGDVGTLPDGSSLLNELHAIAPVRAVYGNTDAPGQPELKERLDITIGNIRIVVTHGHELGSPTPESLVAAYPHAEVIVYGHTHKPMITRIGDTLVVNPGAAGPKRFDLMPSVAQLHITRGHAHVEILPL